MDSLFTDICKICSQTFSSETDFNRHFFRKHGITLKDYYKQAFNRRDLWTNESIEFKNKNQYFFQDFIHKNNLKNWLKEQQPDIQKQYCTDLLKRRKEAKDLIWAPTEIENRTVKYIPSIAFYNKIFGDYYNLCSSLGFKNKHKKITDNFKININSNLINSKEHYINSDSREQLNIKFDIPIQVKKLEYGDYEYSYNPNKIFIERKSLSDLISSLSSGYERFSKEIERARADNSYLIVMVESKLSEATSFEYNLWQYKRVGMKISSEFVFHNLREMLQKFSNLQFLFVDGREEFEKICKIIFFCDNIDLREFDLQLAYEMKLLDYE